ncbi:MAG: hypothetical protein C0179_04675 [Fervidicoccus sp.]|nr:MAG: hypothetical protein C0179_04675 [Fervidicoccus sp.]
MRYVVKEIPLNILILFLLFVVAVDFATTYLGVVVGSCREFSLLPRMFIEAGMSLAYPVVEFILLFLATVFLRSLQRMMKIYAGLELVIPVLGVFVAVNNITHILLGKC